MSASANLPVPSTRTWLENIRKLTERKNAHALPTKENILWYINMLVPVENSERNIIHFSFYVGLCFKLAESRCLMLNCVFVVALLQTTGAVICFARSNDRFGSMTVN